jgi:omega-6 fatty acid desaturase / acyl-lipid omega-6 desaturase (Delta-12 desaturase)
VGPYLVVNTWLTTITFLQHTDVDTPHLDGTAWTWMKGALCTIDRNYPAFLDALHHHIGTTHVIHHIFSDLPHYNAVEAKFYAKNILGSYHREDSKPVMRSLWEAAQLGVVEHEGNGVWKYK